MDVLKLTVKKRKKKMKIFSDIHEIWIPGVQF